MVIQSPNSDLSCWRGLPESLWFKSQIMKLCLMLAGKNGVMPTTDEVEESLKMMVQAIQFGGDMSGYLVFDRKGATVRFV
ncbi:hypothetical protein MNBD_GAMMA26-1004 [hydrothermal vent metagenome]|uniref:Uncharacterized protein n=1 Tax=hydrothermal vent metagenome TaxID=652676 RepID=A0A3B1ARB6_9ZZZZ